MGRIRRPAQTSTPSAVTPRGTLRSYHEHNEAAVTAERSLGGGIDALRTDGLVRLRPMIPEHLGPLATFIAAFHLGDPVGPGDSFRPWRREREMRTVRAEAEAILAAAAVRPSPGAQAGVASEKSITSGA